ncbi:MAG: four helix bundle protein [Planctomycetota bacterium]
MKDDNVVREKSYAFAIRAVKVHRYLVEERGESVLGKQLLRSGTSIGANVEEAIGGQSRKDFAAKLSIAYKETRESHYWIRLLTDTDYLPKEHAASMLEDAEELMKILGSILKTLKNS